MTAAVTRAVKRSMIVERRGSLLGPDTYRRLRQWKLTLECGHVVHVRPELVVEIAFDGVQASSRYPGGVALRFARVKGYRPDKAASEADTIGLVRALHEGAGRE